jgi:hypothetical protein
LKVSWILKKREMPLGHKYPVSLSSVARVAMQHATSADLERLSECRSILVKMTFLYARIRLTLFREGGDGYLVRMQMADEENSGRGPDVPFYHIVSLKMYPSN